MKEARARYISLLELKLKKKRLTALKHALAYGMQAGQEQCEELINAVHGNLKEAHSKKLALIIRCAEKIIAKNLEEQPRIIIGMAQKLLKNIAEHADAELVAHPTDAALLLNSLHEIVVGSARRKIIISKDQNLTRGSLIIKANKSIIDAQISTQLMRAHELLLA